VNLLAVDLAAKYSAACLMTTTGTVAWQIDSWGRTERGFLHELTVPWTDERLPRPRAMVVEDLPHRLPFAHTVKQVCRIQGRLAQIMDDRGLIDTVVFVPPAEWRKRFRDLKRGTGPDAVVPVAATFGYQPPDLTHRISKAGDKAIARKVATDYCAAFLIAKWAQFYLAMHGTIDAPGTSRYSD
jgi:hypothetical protein